MKPVQQLRSAVYRKPARERPFDEQLLMVDGNVLDSYLWKWHSQSEQSTSKRKRTTLRTPAAAAEEYEARLAALASDGWRPVENWPGNGAPVLDLAAAAPKAPQKAKPKPKPVKRLQLSGSAPKVKAAGLAVLQKRAGALPEDWVTLVTSHGARMFGGRLRLYRPEKALKETRSWVKFWVEKNQPAWRNFAAVVPDAKRLLVLGASIDGDVLVFAPGAKRGYVIFPRSEDEAVGLGKLAEVFGWFLAVAAEAGDTPRATYAPER